MEVPFAMALERGKTLKLADLNAGFTRPDTIALAYFQASLLVDHIVRTYGDAKLQALVQVVRRRASRGTRRSRRRSASRLPDLQTSFDQALDARFGSVRDCAARDSRRDRCAGTTGEGPARPAALDLTALRLTAAAHPGNYAAQLAYGQALAAAGDRAAFEPLEKAAALVPVGDRRRQPARGHGAAGGEARRPDARDGGVSRRCWRRITRRSTRPPPCRARGEGGDEPQALWLAYDRSSRIDPFDPAAHTGLGRLALKNNQRGDRGARVQGGAGARPGRQGVGALRPGEAYLLANGSRPKPRRRRSPRSRSRPASTRAGPAAEIDQGDRRGRGPAMKPLLPAAAVAGLLLWAAGAWRRAAAPTRRTPSRPIARFAGLQWTFARIRYTAWTVPPERLSDS